MCDKQGRVQRRNSRIPKRIVAVALRELLQRTTALMQNNGASVRMPPPRKRETATARCERKRLTQRAISAAKTVGMRHGHRATIILLQPARRASHR